MRKIILYATEDNFIFAMRTAQWLIDHPNSRDAILEFENGKAFYASRNKGSITAREGRQVAA